MAGSSTPERKVRGRPFQKGQSGNPGGKTKLLAAIEAEARKHTPKALSALAAIVSDIHAPAAARVSAAQALLDRGHGKPTQRQEIAVSADLAGALERIRRKAPDGG